MELGTCSDSSFWFPQNRKEICGKETQEPERLAPRQEPWDLH